MVASDSAVPIGVQSTYSPDQPPKALVFPPTPNPEPEMTTDRQASASSAHGDEIGQHLAWIIKHDTRLQAFHNSDKPTEMVVVNGQDLSLAEVVAVS